ncbi:MAG: PilZ domain-containing protein [Elusimicrobia bacterium]|nr:PilZ domain-containing protein [Elusimicrobiota bacterium]
MERRLFERLTAHFPVKFRDTSLDYGLDVFLKDISASGLRISTRERLFLNDYVTLDVKLPDGQDPVPLSGRVCWVREAGPRLYEVGLQFQKVNLVRMHRITKYAMAFSGN